MTQPIDRHPETAVIGRPGLGCRLALGVALAGRQPGLTGGSSPPGPFPGPP